MCQFQFFKKLIFPFVLEEVVQKGHCLLIIVGKIECGIIRQEKRNYKSLEATRM
jgi:hypothetical protein